MSDHQRLDDLRDYEEAERIGARVRLIAERAQAARVAAHPVRRLLYRLTANLPCRMISRDGQPYLERYYLGRLGPITAYLHRFVGRDGDAETHDHPWRALSLVLAGGYTEDRARLNGDQPPQIRQRRVRWGNVLWLHSLHRIAETEPDTWTLFLHGPHRKRWGFVRYIEEDVGRCGHSIYHQPFSPWRGEDWQNAPRGDAAGRQPQHHTHAPP